MPKVVMDKAVQPAAEVGGAQVQDCFELAVSYQPLDMLGQAMTYEANASACQLRCRQAEGCGFFSFFVQLGLCHVADASAQLQAGSVGVLAGPRTCPRPAPWEAKPMTWVSRDAVPDLQGSALGVPTDGIRRLRDMKHWCEDHAACVGFSVDYTTGRWYPKRVGTGFDPRTASWTTTDWGEHWQWYYMEERTDMTS